MILEVWSDSELLCMDLSLPSSFLPEMSAKLIVLLLEYCLHNNATHSLKIISLFADHASLSYTHKHTHTLSFNGHFSKKT